MHPALRLVAAVLVPATAHALDVLASTSLQMCVDRGGGAGSMNCTQQMVVLAALQNAEVGGTGSLVYTVTGKPIDDGSDAYTKHTVVDDVSISLMQSAIKLLYPLTYLRDVNAAPYEQIYTRDGSGRAFSTFNRCKDAPTDEVTGCGWMMTVDASTGSASKVPYSQGFCCRCDVGDDILSNLIPRSNLRCDVFAGKDSAHCLRMGPLWYSVYEIGAPSLSFDIYATISTCWRKPATNSSSGSGSAATAAASGPGCTEPSADCECDMLDSSSWQWRGLPPIGPRMPSRCFPLPSNPDQTACDVRIDLQGTFAPYEGTPDYSSKLLLIPTQCDLSISSSSSMDPCFTKLVEGFERWLLVDRTALTEGSECNKIGVSYEAFQTQGRACQNPEGTCLSDQPDDLYASDISRAAGGGTPRYFLTSYREGTARAGIAGAPAPFGRTIADIQGSKSSALTMAWPTTRFQKSLLSLTFKADSLRIVQKVAPGRIVSASATSFTAMSTGNLLVTIGNTGTVPSRYTLAVDCGDGGILPIPARQLALMPPPSNASQTTEAFPLYTTSDTAAVYACDVILVDALAVQVDRLRVNVSVTAQPHDPGNQGGALDDGTRDGSDASNNATDDGAGAGGTTVCAQACDAWYDLPCAVKQGTSCVQRLGAWAGGLVGVLLAVGLLVKFPFLLSPVMSLLRCMCCRSSSSNSSDSKHNRGKHSSRRYRHDRDRDRDRDRSGSRRRRSNDRFDDSGSDSSGSSSHDSGDADDVEKKTRNPMHASKRRERGRERGRERELNGSAKGSGSGKGKDTGNDRDRGKRRARPDDVSADDLERMLRMVEAAMQQQEAESGGTGAAVSWRKERQQQQQQQQQQQRRKQRPDEEQDDEAWTDSQGSIESADDRKRHSAVTQSRRRDGQDREDRQDRHRRGRSQYDEEDEAAEDEDASDNGQQEDHNSDPDPQPELPRSPGERKAGKASGKASSNASSRGAAQQPPSHVAVSIRTVRIQEPQDRNRRGWSDSDSGGSSPEVSRGRRRDRDGGSSGRPRGRDRERERDSREEGSTGRGSYEPQPVKPRKQR